MQLHRTTYVAKKDYSPDVDRNNAHSGNDGITNSYLVRSIIIIL